MTDVKTQSTRDLKDDFREINFIYSDFEKKLLLFDRDLNRIRKNLPRQIFNRYRKILLKLMSEIRKERIRVQKTAPGRSSIIKARTEKYRHLTNLRMLSSQIPGFITSGDWQSPSFLYSITDNAGIQAGKITGTVNDYKRDVHLDETMYENLFIKEYIDAKFKIFLKAYMVNSGQAAFQTILTYLMAENKAKDNVFCGKNSYFQYKTILKGIFGDKLAEIDETDFSGFARNFRKFKPGAIFLDSLSNSPTPTRPDLRKIREFIHKNATRDTYLVIDNTCMSIFSQPFSGRKLLGKVHLISFESLNKYLQFGLDRVTAGIIVCETRDAGGIFEYRKHAGTNISDSSVFAIPYPNRKILQKRLLRHSRNCLLLAETLSEFIITDKKYKADSVIFPGEENFRGSFFVISFKEKYSHPNQIKRFQQLAISEAKKRNVNMIAGTSFGLNTTRIYLTALYNRYGKPFLRISPGTEDYEEIEEIGRALKTAIRKF